jgi:hypothetical protein
MRYQLCLLCIGGLILISGCAPMSLISPLDKGVVRATLIACNESDRTFALRVNAHGLLALPSGQCRRARILVGPNVLWPGESASSREWFVDAAWILGIPPTGARVSFKVVADRLVLASVVGLQAKLPAVGLRCHDPSDFGADSRPGSARRDAVLRWTRARMACK